jgi:hypothetical protein
LLLHRNNDRGSSDSSDYNDTHDDDDDDDDDDYIAITTLVGATILFNLAFMGHRYARTQRTGVKSDTTTTSTALLRKSCKLYHILIELLLADIGTTTNETSQSVTLVECDDGDCRRTSEDIVLLLTLTYHCLGHLYYEMGMLTESRECLMKLQHLFMSQSDIYESIRWSSFSNIMNEIKLNIVFWKMYVPSPIAIAA